MQSSTVDLRKAVGEFVLDEPIFMDQYSSLFRGINQKSGEEVIIRNLQLSSLQTIKNSNELIQTELKLLKQYESQFVIKYSTFVSTKNNLYLIYENANSTLEQYIRQNPQAPYIQETEAVKYLHEILTGYGPLYKDKVFLKSIRLDSFVVQNKNIKFLELGLVKNFEKFKSESAHGPNFKFLTSLAPEIYLGSPQNSTCDIWPIGLIFYQMLFGEMPWRGTTVEEYFKLAATTPPNLNNKFQKISKLSEEALVKMLTPDVNKRITYEDIVKDSLFTKYTDNLLRREQKIIQKIKKKPECWQAAGMMYTEDPILSIFDLEQSIRKSSVPKKRIKVIDEIKSIMEQSQRAKSMINLGKKDYAETYISKQKSDSHDQPNHKQTAPKEADPNSIDELNRQINKIIEPVTNLDMMLTSSIKKKPSPQSSTKIQETVQVNNQILNESSNPLLDKIIDQATQDNKKTDHSKDFSLEFRKINFRFNHLTDYYSLYGLAAANATKLFKTDLIIFYCFFLYKRLLRSLTKIYEALAKGINIFGFDHWNEYINSFYFLKAVENIEKHLDRVCDIFDKIFDDCVKKVKKLQIPQMEKYINDDLSDSEGTFNNYIYMYLEKVLNSEYETADQSRKLAILKHQIEIVDCLLLNKMSEESPEDGIMNIDTHKEIVRRDDLKILQKYLKEQNEKLSLYTNISGQ